MTHAEWSKEAWQLADRFDKDGDHQTAKLLRSLTFAAETIDTTVEDLLQRLDGMARAPYGEFMTMQKRMQAAEAALAERESFIEHQGKSWKAEEAYWIAKNVQLAQVVDALVLRLPHACENEDVGPSDCFKCKILHVLNDPAHDASPVRQLTPGNKWTSSCTCGWSTRQPDQEQAAWYRAEHLQSARERRADKLVDYDWGDVWESLPEVEE